MLDVLKFIFSSFFVWLGTFFLIAALSYCRIFSINVRINSINKEKKDGE